MKYLIIFALLISTAFAERKEVRKAKLEISEINTMRAGHVALCNLLDHADDKSKCVSEFIKVIDQKTEGMINNVVTDYFNKAGEEIGCRVEQEALIDAANDPAIAYNGNETCAQLKFVLAAYMETKCIEQYTALLVAAEQTPVGETCSELQAEWSAYQESQEPQE